MQNETLLSQGEMIINLFDSDNIDSTYKKVGTEYDREFLNYKEIECMIRADKLDDYSSKSTNESIR